MSVPGVNSEPGASRADPMDPPADPRELVELGREECLTLLGLESLGRLAVCGTQGAPDVVPVNFVMRDDVPMIRTHAGVVFDHMTRGPVTLQADRFDWFHRTGWSVMVQGAIELVGGDFEERDGIDRSDVWAPGDHPILVRIAPTRISGRRIELYQEPLDPAGYL